MNTEENQKLWIENVRENLLLRGRSENTLSNYKSALIRFLNYYGNDANIESFGEKDIIPYLKECFLQQNKSKYTYNLTIAAIRLFYIVCFNRSLNVILLPTSKIDKKLPSILSKDKFIKIFNDEKSLKRKCWLLLAFCCGLRVKEVSRVKVEDMDIKNHKIKIFGKGNKERYTILPDIVIKFLKLYCDEQNIECGYLFKGSAGKNVMNCKTIINYFSKLKEKYNLDDNISFHTLRHSFATYFLMNGGNLFVLKEMLGHKSLSSTAIYVHMANNFNNLEGIRYGSK